MFDNGSLQLVQNYGNSLYRHELIHARQLHTLPSIPVCYGVNSGYMYEGRSKSSRPDLVLFRIKLKYYLLFIVARLRTRHAQYDFWAINILCILAYEHSVRQMVSRMLTPNCAQVSEEVLK